jgi:cytoskeletal protein CcmA (bactofilin family)
MGRGDRDEMRINGLIDKGCSMEGRLAFDGTVQINGTFSGDIISDGSLIIGPDAKVTGRIQVANIMIEGNVEGAIEAKNKIDLRKGCRLVADIVCPCLAIEDGAIFHGQCGMIRMASAKLAGDSDSAYQGENLADESADSLMM